jgi:hypothetical protein
MTFLVLSSQAAQIFPFRKYPPAHTLQYGPACSVPCPPQRLRKEAPHRRTCVCIAAPVIADRSDVGRAVCDSTTSAAFQRRRTARTHRTRVLCTTDRKQNRSSAERSRCSASKAKENLAVVPIAFERPHAEAAGTDCALPTIGAVDLESAAWRIARLRRFGRCYGLSTLP